MGGQVNKAESKVTMMIALMIVVFMVAWTPYSIFALLEQFGSGVNPALAVLPALLAKSSICYNPIIYVGMNSQVQTAPLSTDPSSPTKRVSLSLSLSLPPSHPPSIGQPGCASGLAPSRAA